jgi:glutamyl-tRNA synthetase
MIMVRTRFAPSPTGYLHIGGVRTALFNWLFARQHKGQFLLRIDDTDKDRNNPAALAPILHGLKWCGIDWDEGPEIGGPCGPYFQSEKLTRYQEAVRTLLDKGLAYFDYATEEERKTEREAAQKEKRPWTYSRRWMAESAEDRSRFEAEGRQPAVRLKMPREGACEFHDHIRGDMNVLWSSEQDHGIQRTDGTILYHLANVVDDFDMKITHVIRAEEHLPNTPRQIFMLRGLGYPQPDYAHLPPVAEPAVAESKSKRKLSKRSIPQYLTVPAFRRIFEHGQRIAAAIGLKTSADTFNPVIVDFFEQVGYLPDAIINYLVLLGWAFDDKKEDFTRQEMIDLFSLDRVNKEAASFDIDKLFAFQDRFMKCLPLEAKLSMCMPYLQRAGFPVDEAKVRPILQAAADRIKVAGDILDYTFFFVPDDRLAMSEDDFEKRLKKPAEAAGLLRKYREALAGSAFDAASLEAGMSAFVQAEGIKLAQIVHAVRVAVTGKGVGFGLFETLASLGKERTLARIDRVLARL